MNELRPESEPINAPGALRVSCTFSPGNKKTLSLAFAVDGEYITYETNGTR